MAQPNASTPSLAQLEMDQDGGYVTQSTDTATPYNHLERLASKLFGAAELSIDKAIEHSYNEADTTQNAAQPQFVQYLPPVAQSFVMRNLTVIVLSGIGAIIFFGIRLLRR